MKICPREILQRLGCSYLLPLAIGLLLASSAVGNVVISITGVVGGTTFDWEFTSTDIVTDTAFTDASDSGFNVGLPFPDDDNDNVVGIGSLLPSGDTIVNSSQGDLSTTGSFSFTIDSGPELFPADPFTIDVEATNGGRIDIRPGDTITIPASPGTHTFTYSGSGTATLSSGTFDSVFNDGTRVWTAAPSPRGTNTVTFEVTTVPEPSPVMVLGLCFMGIGARTYIRLRNQVSSAEACG